MSLFFGHTVFKKLPVLCHLGKRAISNMSETKKLTLYGDVASPPVRFVMMTASQLNIDLDFYNINLFKAENRSEFYKKINPFQKVPALSVNGDVICDSHAIALYFCRITNNQELYPEDTMLRTKIDEWLYFDTGVLFVLDSAVFSNFFVGKWPADDAQVNNWHTALDYLQLKLSKQKWLTGDDMRLCDLCCGTTVSSLELLLPLQERHDKVKEWLRVLKNHSCFEINQRGLNRLQNLMDNIKPQ